MIFIPVNPPDDTVITRHPLASPVVDRVAADRD
jgi:hypothetical protein